MKTLTITERKAIQITSYDYENGNLSMVTTHGEFSLNAPKEAILRLNNGHKIFEKDGEEYIKIWCEGIPEINKDNSYEAVITFEKFVELTEPENYEIKYYAIKFMELWERI